jgi:4-hydroxy-tetrahydrodipicolinate synthase
MSAPENFARTQGKVTNTAARSSRFSGSLVPLVTPFLDGRVDNHALEGLIEWHIDSGTHGLVVCGTTGEPAALSINERLDLMRTVTGLSRGRLPVIAGTGTSNLDETLHLTHAAENLGVNAVLVLTPYYVRPTQEGMFRYFSAVAQDVELPVILYDIPGRTSVALAVETVVRLRDAHKNIVGIKEATKDFEHVNRLFHACGEGFQIYCGTELFSLAFLALGAAGHINALANLMPREVSQLYILAKESKWDDARALHNYLIPICDALFLETNPGPLKQGLAWLGKISPEVRPPLAPLSATSLASFKAVYESYTWG